MTNDVEHLFNVLICHLCSFFGVVSVQTFCPFKKSDCFLINGFGELFIYSGYESVLCRYVICKYFLPACGVSFCSLNRQTLITLFYFHCDGSSGFL